LVVFAQGRLKGLSDSKKESSSAKIPWLDSLGFLVILKAQAVAQMVHNPKIGQGVQG
jgi:hypothetical protein